MFVGGISSDLEGEEMPVKVEGFNGGDRTNLDLPHSQQLLLEKLQKLGKPIVFVMTNGSALSVNWAKKYIPAIVDCWYPGEEGGNAVADVLFGDYNPAGRLPVTFYKSVNDLPSFEDYSMKGRTYRYFKGEPLFAFGFGLSYTDFKYSSISLEQDHVLKEGKIKLKVTVTNAGQYAGDEVIQVCFKQPESVTDKPIQSLVAFRRVSFKKGEQKEISFDIQVSQLRNFDPKLGRYDVAKGQYELLVGAASDDIRRRTTVEVN